MKCQLCKNDYEKLSKSHIYPKGFFNRIRTKRKVDSFRPNGQKGRKLQNALYDSEILCKFCEEKIEIYDDYAIKVFRDKCDSFEPRSQYSELKVLLFRDIDKRKLRGFIASLLWRMSKSKQLEIASLSIGDHYENLIANEIENEGNFTYIHVFAISLEDPLHEVFSSPRKIKIDPTKISFNLKTVNGWEIMLPNLILRTSLDRRPHPQNYSRCFQPEETGEEANINASTSLNTGDDHYFMFTSIDKHEDYAKDIYSAYSNKQRYSK